MAGDGNIPSELVAARAAPTDAQFSALQWCAIIMNAFNRVSLLSGHPVRPRTAPSPSPSSQPPTASRRVLS
ncbi:hypothetical protein M1D93_08860 [Arthrobacter sp. Z1-9]